MARSLLLLVAACSTPAYVLGRPPIDSIHKHMEPSHPKPRAPQLKRPYSGGGLVTPRNAVLLMPAAAAGMAVLCPDVLARVLVQVLCFIGSLIEPFDSLLPKEGPLRALVVTIKQAKRAYNIKHGIPMLDDGVFFEDEDEDEEVEAAAKSSTKDEEKEEEEDEEDDDEVETTAAAAAAEEEEAPPEVVVEEEAAAEPEEEEPAEEEDIYD